MTPAPMVISMANAYFHEFIFDANISYRSDMIHKKCQWILLVLVWIVDIKSWMIFLWRVFQLYILSVYTFSISLLMFLNQYFKKIESLENRFS